MATKKKAPAKQAIAGKTVAKKTSSPKSTEPSVRDFLFAWTYISTSKSAAIGSAKTPEALAAVTAGILKTLAKHVSSMDDDFTSEISGLIRAVNANKTTVNGTYQLLKSFGKRKWSKPGHHPRMDELVASFTK